MPTNVGQLHADERLPHPANSPAIPADSVRVDFTGAPRPTDRYTATLAARSTTSIPPHHDTGRSGPVTPISAAASPTVSRERRAQVIENAFAWLRSATSCRFRRRIPDDYTFATGATDSRPTWSSTFTATGRAIQAGSPLPSGIGNRGS